MWRKAIWLILWVVSLPSWADPYIRFEEKGKIGLKDESGRVLLPATFEALGWSDGNFSVIGQITGYKLKNKWGIIHLQKQFLTPADFESLTYAGGDRVVVSHRLNPFTVKFGCLDFEGKIVVPFNYDGVSIVGLRAIVSIKNGARVEQGVIDLSDKGIIPVQYERITPLGTLRYAVEKKNSKVALFAEDGRQLTPFTIDSISSFHHGYAIFYQNFSQGVIDREGEIKAQANYRQVAIDKDGTIQVRDFDTWHILDLKNHEVDQVVADELQPVGGKLYVASLAGKQGIMDDKFKPVLSKTFDYLETTDGHHWIAGVNGKFGVIRKDSTWIIPPRFDSVRMDEMFIRVSENTTGKYGWAVYDTFGIMKTSTLYDRIDPYTSSHFVVKKRGYWGAINRYGEEFLKCVFDGILEFKGNVIAVNFHGQFGIITKDEKWLLPPQTAPISLINDDLYFIKNDTITFVKDFSGQTIYFTPHPIHFDGEHFEVLFPSGAKKLINLQGQELSVVTADPEEQNVLYFPLHEGLRRIMKDEKFGFVDDKGRLRLANRYDDASDFHEGLAAIKLIGHWGFVDLADHILINPNYDAVEAFRDGLAVVQRAGKSGLIDKSGKVTLPLRYDRIKRLPTHMYLIESGSLFGLADKKGNVLIDARYNSLEDLENGYVLVSRDGKFGVLSFDGLSHVPIQYDVLAYDRSSQQYRGLIRSTWKTLK